MKSAAHPRRLLALSALLLASGAFAATQTYQDSNVLNTWNLADANWDAGVVWTNGNDAVFAGTGESVSVGTVTANGVTFSAAGYTLASGTITLGGATPLITADADATINSLLAGTAGLTKAGTGTLTVSNGGNSGLSGNITVNGGVLIFNSTGSYVDVFAKSSVVTVNAGAELRVTGGANGYVHAVSEGAMFLNGGIFDYQGATHGHMGNITLSNGATWKASAGGGYSGENMQLNGDVTVVNTGGNTTASTMSNFSQGLGLSGNRTFNVADVTGTSAADLIVSMELEDRDSGANGIIKTGAGTMRLTTGATYTGTTVVSGGTLLFDSGSTLRNSSGITVNTGATVELGATNIFTGGHGSAVANTRVITVDGGTLVMNGNMDSRFGNVTLKNGGTWTSNRGLSNYDALLANTDTGAATVRVTNTGGSTAASTMNGSGGIHLQGPQNFDIDDVTGDAGADLLVQMELGDTGSAGGTAGGVVKNGAGTMAISRRASYLGGTVINGGVLALTGGGGGSGTIRGTVTVNSGATLRLGDGDVTGYDTGANSLTTINLTGGTMDVAVAGAGKNQTLGGAAINMTGGAITGVAGSNLDFFQGTSTLNSLASATTSTISGTTLSIRQTGGLTITVADGAAATDLSISSVIRNDGSYTTQPLIKDGAGLLALSGANTYTGATVVTAGTLSVSTITNGGVAGGLGASTNVAGNLVFNGGALQYTGASVVSDRAFTINAGKTAVIDVASAGANLSLAGATGAATTGGLTKTGAGTLTLRSGNTYTGATSVAAGRLVLMDDNASSAITVESGASLVLSLTDGFGNGVNNVVVKSGAILQSGDGVRADDYSLAENVALQSGSVLQVAVGGANASTLVVNTTLTFDAAQKISLVDLGAQTNTKYTLINGADALADVSGWQLTNAGWTGSFLNEAGFVSVTLTAIPEPSTYGFLGAGALGAVALVRRRRKVAR